MAASVITRDLEECHTRTRHLVQYLATHLSEGLFYRYGEEGEQMDIFGDASFAPGGSASRTGWILCLGTHALTWGSQRQTLIALSTCEAVLIAATSAVLAAQPMMLLLEEIRRRVHATLRCDNAAAIAILRKEELSLRNRHLSIRAEYLRELPENVEISYTSTEEQKADVLTKALAKGLHQKAVRDIGTLDSDLRVGVAERERNRFEGSGDTSEKAVSALAFAIKVDQLERVQRSSLIQHPSLTPSLSVDQLERMQRSSLIQHPSLTPSLSVSQLERVQRSSQIQNASSGSNLDNRQLGVKLPERTEDATRLCCDPISLGFCAHFSESSSEKVVEESSARETSGDSSVERTFGKDSVKRSFETVLSEELSSSSSSSSALAAEHADIRQELRLEVMMMTIVSAQSLTLCAESDGDSSDSVFYTRTTSSPLGPSSSHLATSSPLGPSSSHSATSSPLGPSNLFGSRMTSTEMNNNNKAVDADQVKDQVDDNKKEPQVASEADFGEEEEAAKATDLNQPAGDAKPSEDNTDNPKNIADVKASEAKDGDDKKDEEEKRQMTKIGDRGRALGSRRSTTKVCHKELRKS